MDKVTIYRVLWSTLKLDATNRHGLADVITLEDHRRALDAERERLKVQIDYSIQLQRLIESLKRDDTPAPELYHHTIIVDFKRQLADLTRKAAGMPTNGELTLAERCNDLQRALDAEREKVAKLEKIQAIDLKNNNEYRQQLATLQAQLAAAKKVKADYDRWLSGGVYFATAEYEKHVADHGQQVEALQAQLLQVEGELADEKTAYKKLSEQWNKDSLDLTTARQEALLEARLSVAGEMCDEPDHACGSLQRILDDIDRLAREGVKG